MNHKLIDLPLLARFKDKFERKLEDLNTEVDEKFEEVNANMLILVSFDAETGTLTTKSADYQETPEVLEEKQ